MKKTNLFEPRVPRQKMEGNQRRSPGQDSWRQGRDLQRKNLVTLKKLFNFMDSC